MKSLQVVTAIGVVALAGLGVTMAMTNPSQEVYEVYATQQLTKYLQENLCPKVPTIFGSSLQGECRSRVNSDQSEIKKFISKSTQRQNFILFSIYKTELSANTILPFLPSSLLPSYHFETVAAFDSFYPYQLNK